MTRSLSVLEIRHGHVARLVVRRPAGRLGGLCRFVVKRIL